MEGTDLGESLEKAGFSKHSGIRTLLMDTCPAPVPIINVFLFWGHTNGAGHCYRPGRGNIYQKGEN